MEKKVKETRLEVKEYAVVSGYVGTVNWNECNTVTSNISHAEASINDLWHLLPSLISCPWKPKAEYHLELGLMHRGQTWCRRPPVVFLRVQTPTGFHQDALRDMTVCLSRPQKTHVDRNSKWPLDYLWKDEKLVHWSVTRKESALLLCCFHGKACQRAEPE